MSVSATGQLIEDKRQASTHVPARYTWIQILPPAFRGNTCPRTPVPDRMN